MPNQFSFTANGLVGAIYLNRANLTTGMGPGVNDPDEFSAVAPDQAIEAPGDVDVFAVTLIAGETYTFDVDTTTSSIDLELTLIDHTGLVVAESDDPGGDADPLISVTPAESGTYFVAVHEDDNDYINGFFAFDGAGGATGDYQFVISTPTLPSRLDLTNGDDDRGFGNGAQNVRGLDGDDELLMGNGKDIASGGDGDDTLKGGNGDDELNGADGKDKLVGQADDDVLIGGAQKDNLSGGKGEDNLSGGSHGDVLNAGQQDDILWGEDGNDVLKGGGGDDFLRGGDGVDTLYGGDGDDSFHFLPGESDFDADFAEDEIADFEDGDRIDLTDLALGTLDYVGGSEFTGSNQVRVVDYRASLGFQEVRVNLDGDTSDSEFAVIVYTDKDFTLIESDFIL